MSNQITGAFSPAALSIILSSIENSTAILKAANDAADRKLESAAELAKLVEELLLARNANTRGLKFLAQKISPGWCKAARKAVDALK